MEQQINEKVMEIAQSVHKTIPVAWENLFINITLTFDGGEVYYFFNEEGKSTTNSGKRILLFSLLQYVTINSEVLYSLRVDFILFENLVTIITLWILVKISSFIYNTLFCEVSLAIAGIQEPLIS